MTKPQLNTFKPSYRDPKSVGSILEKTFDILHIKNKLEQYSAFPHWEEIVGEEISAVASPEKLIKGNVLQLRVIDACWVQELSMRKQEILDKIFSFVQNSGRGAVIQDICFITGNPKTIKSKKKGAK